MKLFQRYFLLQDMRGKPPKALPSFLYSVPLSKASRASSPEPCHSRQTMCRKKKQRKQNKKRQKLPKLPPISLAYVPTALLLSRSPNPFSRFFYFFLSPLFPPYMNLYRIKCHRPMNCRLLLPSTRSSFPGIPPWSTHHNRIRAKRRYALLYLL